MQRIRDLWHGGLVGKIIIAGGALSVFAVGCCILPFIVGALSPSRQATIGIAATAQAPIGRAVSTAPKSTEMPTPTEVLASTETPAPVPTPTSVPTPTPLPAIGQTIEIGNLSWKVTQVKNLGKRIKSGNQFIADLVTQGHFLDIRYEVENTGKDPIGNTGQLPLRDDQGRTFAPAFVLSNFIDEPCNTAISLNPGAKTTCEAIYDVPDGVGGLKLEVNGADGVFSNSTVLVDLGSP